MDINNQCLESETNSKSVNSKHETLDNLSKEQTIEIDVNDFDNMSSEIKGQSTLLPSNTQNFTKEMLAKAAKSFVTNINSKRSQDSLLMDEYKKAMSEYTAKSIKSVEDHYFQIYESTGKVIQEKVEALYNSLENIKRYENEIKDFKQDIESVLRTIQTEFPFE